MQRKSAELNTTMQEYFDVDWRSVKFYLRRQVAKCVNECKSQASNAKRIVGTIKEHRLKKVPPPEGAIENGDWDSDDDFDYWDSDFDEDFDDEVSDPPPPPPELQHNLQDGVEKSENAGVLAVVASEVDTLNNNTLQAEVTEKLDETLVPACSTSNSPQVSIQKNVIPRPPIKRPPSQPPPPPIPQPPSQEEPLEEYEIPIGHHPDVSAPLPPAKPLTHQMFLNHGCHVLNGSEPTETYEVIQPVEENYEIVQSPPTPVELPEKPRLPPRLPPAAKSSTPPPIPVKPKKYQENATPPLPSVDSCRSLNRPKLPVKQEDESGHETSIFSPGAVLGATILNSFLGRRNSNSSSLPRLSTYAKDRSNSISIFSTSGSNSLGDNQSTHSSSPEKDGFFTVGSSSFINSVASPTAESTDVPQLSLQKQEKIAQSMATRPLPPVPQRCLSDFPWFHEIERENAECQIRELHTDGAFVVRPSVRAGKENPYTLTVFQNGKVFHLNIRQRPDDTFALGKEKKKEKTFLTVADLIGHHQKEPILLTSRGETAGQTVLGVFPDKK